jgi:adenylate kinase family enzyme
MRIHIFGASGSGTTTLGRALAARLGIAFLDSDDFFWKPTVPPFTTKTEIGARRAALSAATEAAGSWVLSGSMTGWGDFLIPRLELAIYLYLPPGIRMARLASRERERYGARIDSGDDMRATHLEFMAWAGRYDTAGLEQRSRASHAEWMKKLCCPILRIEGDLPLEESVGRALALA